MFLNPVIFNWIVILQIWPWMYFYTRKESDFEKYHYPVLICGSSAILILFGLWFNGLFSISNYPVPLVLFYMTAVLGTYLLFKKRDIPFNERISLAFLLVFFSSFFWEGPLHIMDLLSNGLTQRFIIQTLHVLPAIFLSQYYKVESWKSLLNWVMLANMITLGILILELTLILTPFESWTFLIRGLNLIILLKMFLDQKIIKKKQ